MYRKTKNWIVTTPMRAAGTLGSFHQECRNSPPRSYRLLNLSRYSLLTKKRS